MLTNFLALIVAPQPQLPHGLPVVGGQLQRQESVCPLTFELRSSYPSDVKLAGIAPLQLHPKLPNRLAAATTASHSTR